jgi:hypothetical protein
MTVFPLAGGPTRTTKVGHRPFGLAGDITTLRTMARRYPDRHAGKPVRHYPQAG